MSGWEQGNAALRRQVVEPLGWSGPVFEIVSGEGCDLLCRNVTSFLEEQAR